ncbi:phytanoyl-CoA dioxygenase family protein [Pseudomonas aeruginosa]
MFWPPDDRTIFPHEFDLAYPMFKCIDLQASGISREQLVDAELDAGDVLVWPPAPHMAYNNRSGHSLSACRSSSSRRQFHQLNRGQHENLDRFQPASVFPDEAITEDNLDHYLPAAVRLLAEDGHLPRARFSRQFGHAPKIHDFIREPRLATLSASDAGSETMIRSSTAPCQGLQARQ